MKPAEAIRGMGIFTIAMMLNLGAVMAQSSGAQSAKEVICNVLSNIHWLLYSISGGVAVLVVTIQGLKWIGSAEDPALRKAAKSGIIHAFVGLILVQSAIWIISMTTIGTCGITNP
ncbi:MAG: hypothetical protein GF416_01220 [Candidatus Altiarchaeales archaeon]|nr:hypothetical protein [Candidatus Altiarchaeales archaeon]MBD3415736.1 hypothetical protein [Candidatus Altiarchaeales archaeon]